MVCKIDSHLSLNGKRVSRFETTQGVVV